MYNKSSPCEVCAIYQVFYNHSIACYEKQTEILVVQHDLFHQTLWFYPHVLFHVCTYTPICNHGLPCALHRYARADNEFDCRCICEISFTNKWIVMELLSNLENPV